MKKSLKKSPFLLSAAALALLVSGQAAAQRAWLLPSATVLSGPEWVAVDAAVSNELFKPKLGPLALDGLRITAPDGSAIAADSRYAGNLRNGFEFKPTAPGTYKISAQSETWVASYTTTTARGSRSRRWVGAPEDYAAGVPENAENVNVSRLPAQYLTFVTVGKPDTAVLRPLNRGLELVIDPHPNDLYAGEAARVQFLLDGVPAPGLVVSVIADGARYRDALGEQQLRTDDQGAVSVTWPHAGLYWLHVAEDNGELVLSGSGAPEPIAPPKAFPVGSIEQPTRRASLTATLEVLQP